MVPTMLRILDLSTRVFHAGNNDLGVRIRAPPVPWTARTEWFEMFRVALVLVRCKKVEMISGKEFLRIFISNTQKVLTLIE